MKKTVQVLMLLTNSFGHKKGGLIKLDNILMIAEYDNSQYPHSYHLYFTSNEEIKEGDWVARKGRSGFIDILQNPIIVSQYSYSKVIATTDKSLNLPLIPQSFIEEYVKSNGEIEEVDILITDNEIVAMNGVIGKKQTLEEAADEFAKQYTGFGYQIAKYCWEQGAKWQQSNS